MTSTVKIILCFFFGTVTDQVFLEILKKLQQILFFKRSRSKAVNCGQLGHLNMESIYIVFILVLKSRFQVARDIWIYRL